jgi:hypothetical protein
MNSEENLIDCDYCLNTWDGNAQCTCDGAMGLLEAEPEIKEKFITKVLPSGEIMVAILISFHYGYGWSSSTNNPEYKKLLLHHPKLVQYIMDNQSSLTPASVTSIKEIWREIRPNDDEKNYPIFKGVNTLQIAWVPLNGKILVENLNGAEYYRVLSEQIYILSLSDTESKNLETSHEWAILH